MKGDFSQVRFNPADHFSAVLMQQGRVMLDADHNEQVAILLHTLRTLTRDLFGPHGGPTASGFELALLPQGATRNLALYVSPGHYYVDGLLCECAAPGCTYQNQPDAPQLNTDLVNWLANATQGSKFWIYLDVWERHISWVEDDSIREVALGGPDTCTRSKIVWQLKALNWDERWTDGDCAAPLASLWRAEPTLAARLDPGLLPADPCLIAPDSRYRGAENQLYRIEVHRGGRLGDKDPPTFKWSRDNGSVATAWLGTEDRDLIIAHTRGFEGQIWVELSDDRNDLEGRPGLLVRVSALSGDRLSIDPATIPSGGLPAPDPTRHPCVRRWDQAGNDTVILDDGAVPIMEGDVGGGWGMALEDGIQIRFGADSGHEYRTGDYWLIAARVATGSIDWPSNGDTVDPHPAALPPFGIEHHYAALGILAFPLGAKLPEVSKVCRRCVDALPGHECPPPKVANFPLANERLASPPPSAVPGKLGAAGSKAPPRAQGTASARRNSMAKKGSP